MLLPQKLTASYSPIESRINFRYNGLKPCIKPLAGFSTDVSGLFLRLVLGNESKKGSIMEHRERVAAALELKQNSGILLNMLELILK